MNFINNWLREITLGAGVTECPLDLPDGTYRLVMADGLGAAATRIEVIGAVVSDGAAELQRGLEGTDDQEWGEGSVIHSTLTAGVLLDVLSRLQSLEAATADLDARVTALEPSTRLYLRITFTDWYYGAYSRITGVAAYSGGGPVQELDLSLFVQAEGQGGSYVDYSSGGVVIGTNDQTANIDCGVNLDPSWDELRITITDSYEFGADVSILTSFSPENIISSDSFPTNGDGGIDIVLALPV